MSDQKPQTDSVKESHKLSPEQKKILLSDLKEQKKRKNAWRNYSDPVLAKKHNVTTSTLEYYKRNLP